MPSVAIILSWIMILMGKAKDYKPKNKEEDEN